MANTNMGKTITAKAQNKKAFGLKLKIFKDKKTNFYVGLGITAFFLLITIVGYFWTPYNPNAMDVDAKYSAMSFTHLFGCDNFGRDIFSRVVSGLGTTFFVGLGTVLIGGLVGIIIGAICGYFGGLVDEIGMRIMDALYAFPSLLLALVFVSLLGSGKYQVIIALGIAFIPSFSRIVRAEYMRCRDLDYVKSARLFGASHFRVIFVHILPNITPVLVSSAIIGFNNAVLAEAGLSFLGIGVQPPDASLGEMLSSAQSFLFSTPWYALCPGIVMIIMILGVSLMAEGVE